LSLKSIIRENAKNNSKRRLLITDEFKNAFLQKLKGKSFEFESGSISVQKSNYLRKTKALT